MHLLTTGDLVALPNDKSRFVLRSIDWTSQTVTLENLSADPLDFKARFMYVDTRDCKTPIDLPAFRIHYGKLVKYAENRSSGRAKVSRACLKRLREQAGALNS